MRAAILIDALGRGGAERQALNATLELTRLGCDVELIHYYDDDIGVPVYDHQVRQEARLTCLPKCNAPVRFIWRLTRYLRQRAFDVVHAFKGCATVYGALAGRMAGIPVVLGGYRVEYHEGRRLRLAHRCVNRLLDGWVVNSCAIINSMVRAVGVDREKVFVLYNGLDPGAFVSALTGSEAKQMLGLDAQSETVSIIARLRPQKNHLMFLEMAACLLRHRPNVRFLIIGDGELEPLLQARTMSLGISESVRFLGNRSDIADVLAATDVSVLTSHYEGLANALLESMAAGKPVVTTDYAGVEELVTDGQQGLIVPRGDAPAMARRIASLLDDAGLRQRMGETGRQTVEARFSMGAMGAHLLRIYEQCLERSGAVASKPG